MRYATWQLCWMPDPRYGSGPESVIAERGGSAEGVFSTGANVQDTIVGYVYGDVSLTDLDNWNVMEITSAEALTLAKSLQQEATIDDKGHIIFPLTGSLV